MRVLLLAAVLCSLAQSPPGNGSTLHTYTDPAKAAAPWTDLEQARIDAMQQENRAIDAEQKLLNVQRERLTAKVAAFKAAAERDRPGWIWNTDTGAWSEVKK